MNTLLLGDSHTDIFFRMGLTTRFDSCQCASSIFTQHRFNNPLDEDLWTRLNPWFAANAVTTSQLIISAGEIDIRAHFWRHIPRAYRGPDDINQYVHDSAVRYYHRLVEILDQYGLSRIVVWGAPVAGDRADYNFSVPFSGTSQTRNRLIHLWNREFLTVIKNDARIALATAYYDFVNPDSYSTVTPNPSHDGVHWHDRFGPEFWETLVKPALESGASQVGKNWNAVYEDHFDLAEAESTGRGQYDTWARTDQLLSSEGIDRQIVINGVQYSWVRHDQRPLLPETYIELVLT